MVVIYQMSRQDNMMQKFKNMNIEQCLIVEQVKYAEKKMDKYLK